MGATPDDNDEEVDVDVLKTPTKVPGVSNQGE